MTYPLFSIITVCKNSAAYIEGCIQSVLDQSYQNMEYIIIDGGSIDGTIDIIKKYSDRLTYWVSERDTGMYNAVNKGLAKISGDIIAYINSDDYYLPNSLAVAASFFENNKDIDLIYGDMHVTDSDGKVIYCRKYPSFRWLLFASMNYSTIGQPSSFWRRKVHDKVGYFDETMRMAGDHDFYAKVGHVCKVKHVDHIFAALRLHKMSLTETSMDVSVQEVKAIHRRYMASNQLLRMLQVPLGIVGDVQFKILNHHLIWVKLLQWLAVRG